MLAVVRKSKNTGAGTTIGMTAGVQVARSELVRNVFLVRRGVRHTASGATVKKFLLTAVHKCTK